MLSYIGTMRRLGGATPDSNLNYWAAYARYLLCFALDSKNPEEKRQEEAAINEGLDLLEEIKDKNSDHYALLSLLGGLDLNFTNAMMLPFKGMSVGSKAKTAIEKDPTNPRAYVALGIYDYYTPKRYGGMKIAEDNFLKALSLKVNNTPTPYSPNWGHPEAYLFLVRYYRYAKRPDNALRYLNEGLKHYPDFELLKRMKKKLESPGN